ncbi:MAG: FAD-binding oxidoreductase, partial [Nitrospinota bacterium]
QKAPPPAYPRLSGGPADDRLFFMAIAEDLLTRLREKIPKERILEAFEERITYSRDATQRAEAVPDVVVQAVSTEEVEEVVRLAHRERIPITPRGAGTSTTGGAIPVSGGIVLDLSRMNRIKEIDTDNLLAVVEPGVVTAKFQGEVEKLGLFYPPDPASKAACTLGGNAAECAGGPRAVKYGVTKDYIIGLKAVTPAFGRIRTGVRTAKGVVGYDLTKLLVGSEGTLGVITEMTIRLVPKPEATGTMTAAFPGVIDASETVSKIIASRILPSMLELMDRSAVRAAEEYLHAGLPVDSGALLLIQVDGPPESIPRQLQRIQEICREKGADLIRVAESPEEAETLFAVRRSLATAILRVRPTKINEDITVPRSRIPEMIRRLQEISERRGHLIITFGHAGDGNLHVNVMTDERNADEMASALEAVRDIFVSTIEMDGTLSGEHGVGLTKSEFLPLEQSPNLIELQKQIKAIFDPRNIMNPGKIFWPVKH